ncbi:MAG: TIGR00282 family metallophosphoesterase [Nitrospirae bacterium]|nr:TIGR00282 family metallophosphoesterase [Nitrospirota bacterium]
MKILFISDIVGGPGRRAVKQHLQGLREKHSVDLIIANGENSAGGFGITQKVAEELLGMGIDILTSGNHIWDKKEVMNYLGKEDRLIRPANYPPGVPGYGSALVTAKDGTRVGVLNLMGRVFMANLDCPFRVGSEEVEKLKDAGAAVVFVDFHAEATSEKLALARYLDGSITALVGTHTHVQTADERILPKGTAYITDVGMTGPMDSVIGVTPEAAIERFLTHIPQKFDTAKGPAWLQAVIVEADPATGLADGITRICLESEA